MKAMQVLKNKKGFTLIEIIVVLIILAILAAAGIPSMIGFIEDSRAKAFIAEARTGMVAAQVILAENDGVAPTGMPASGAVTDARFLKLVAGITNINGFTNTTVDATKKQVYRITYAPNANYVIRIDTVTPENNFAGKTGDLPALKSGT